MEDSLRWGQSFSAPLSFAQERLWFIDQLDPGAITYNRPTSFRLLGPLQATALETSLNEILARHEVLRARFRRHQPQQIIASAEFHPLAVNNLEHLAPHDRAEEAARLTHAETKRPFDLAQEPPIRFQLLRLAPNEHFLLLTVHHIAFDGWSERIFLRELTTLYAAYSDAVTKSPLTELTTCYTAYARSQRELLDQDALAQHVNYWREHLAGPRTPLQLPTDFAASDSPSDAGSCYPLQFSPSFVKSLRTFSQQQHATLFMTLLAGFEALLFRYTEQEDLVLGVPMAGRVDKGTTDLVGLFINTLPVRVDLSGNPTFSDLLRRVRKSAIAAYTHQNAPLQQIVEKVSSGGSPRRAPLFQSLINLQPETEPITAAGVSFQRERISTGTSKLDLSIDLVESPAGLRGEIEFRTELFADDAIALMGKRYQQLLETVVDQPELRIADVCLMDQGERRQVLVEWNATQNEVPGKQCLHNLFEANVRAQPEKTAVVFQDTCWSYAELDERANQIAHFIRGLGKGPNLLVALCAERSAEMIAAILGVLKAGAAYVPLDSRLPESRKRAVLDETQAIVLTTHARLHEDLPLDGRDHVCLERHRAEIARQPRVPLNLDVAHHELAYVIYTSGSTGDPKGVLIEHHSAANYAHAAVEEYGLRCDDRVLQFATIAFDASIEEIFGCFAAGAALVVRDEDAVSTVEGFLRFLRASQASFLSLPTAYWHDLVTQLADNRLQLPAHVRAVVLGGEKAHRSALADWWQCVPQSCQLFNSYGPTEATVVSTVHEVRRLATPANEIPIGHPVRNTRIYVVNSRGDLAPPGMPGELCIAGAGLARGYLRAPELTSQRFVPCPFEAEPEARMYRTGDRVRWNTRGELEFLGRLDNQVKIRGFRVEPEEVATSLNRHRDVQQCVVLPCVVLPHHDSREVHLVAYVVSKEGVLSVSQLRGFLSGLLADYMIPTHFVFLEALPLTAQGKIDIRGLPAVDPSNVSASTSCDPPRTEAEVALAQIWQEVLGLPEVGVHNNFFDLGGHSLKATQVATRVHQRFGLELPLRDLFRFSTVADLATHLETLQGPTGNGRSRSLLSIAQARRAKRRPA